MNKQFGLARRQARRPRRDISRRSSWGSRSSRLEQLEDRSLLAVIGGGTGAQPVFDSWQNPLEPLDVNADGRVSALDALVVINDINLNGARQLPPTPGRGIPVGGGPIIPHADGERVVYVDVNGDGRLSPLDALTVINKLNAAAGEQVRIRLVATDVAGNPITSTPVDSDFQLRGFVQDIRASAQGVFSAYGDIDYNSGVVSVDGAVVNDPFYPNGIVVDTSTLGLVDEVGGSASSLTAPGPEEKLMFTIPFHADAAGVATFTITSAETPDAVLVYGSDVAVPPAEVDFVSTMLLVGDFPTVSINDQTVTEGDDGSVDMTFTVTLSAPATLPVTVDFATINGTALSGQDFTAAADTLTFETGESTKTIVVPILGDLAQEATESFTVQLSNVTNATLAKATGVGTILDNEIPPVAVSIGDAMVTEGNSGTIDALFTVTLAEASTAEVSVNFATTDGSATSGVDFTASSGTVTFAPGETSKTVAVPVTGDTLFEVNETFTVNLSGGLGVLILDGEGIGTIINDDDAPQIAINDVTANEGLSITTNAVFTVSLSAPAGVQINVDFATAGQTAVSDVDFTATSGTLNLLPGDTIKTIQVPILSDSDTDAGETFAVNLSNATFGTIADRTGIGTILDPPNDVVRIRLAATDTNGAPITNALVGEDFFIEVYVQDRREPAEGVFQAFLDVFYPEQVVQADAPLQYGSDYENDRRANLATPGIIDEAGAADGLTPLGPSERLLFRAPFTALANGVARFIADPADDQVFNQVLVFGSDDPVDPAQILYVGTVLQIGPPPTLSIDDVTVVEGTDAVFTVSLSNTTLVDVTVDFGTFNGTAVAPGDYIAKTGAVTFPAEGPLTQQVRVSVNSDLLDEGDETFFVRLANSVGAPIADNEGVATILATPPLISIDDVQVIEGHSGSVDAVFTVALSKVSNLPITMTYATASGTATSGIDFVPASGSLDFAPGETVKTITVSVNGDLVDEPDESFTVVLSNQTNALFAKATGVGTIVDDEISPGSLSGYVYVDGNGNGLRDPGEGGIANVFVDMQGVALGTPVFQSTITGPDGSYTFAGLQPGRYIIREIQPGFFADGRDTIGSQGGETFNDEFHITLAESVNGFENNFGEGGLRSDFLTKRLFLGSAPTDGVVSGVSLAAGDMWFSFDRGFSLMSVQATSNTGRPVYMTLYDENMRVIAQTTPAGLAALEAAGVTGRAFFLRVGGGSHDVSLAFNVLDANLVDTAIEDEFLLEVL